MTGSSWTLLFFLLSHKHAVFSIQNVMVRGTLCAFCKTDFEESDSRVCSQWKWEIILVDTAPSLITVQSWKVYVHRFRNRCHTFWAIGSRKDSIHSEGWAVFFTTFLNIIRIFHLNSKFHPHKFQNSLTHSQRLLEVISENAVDFFSDEAPFHSLI